MKRGFSEDLLEAFSAKNLPLLVVHADPALEAEKIIDEVPDDSAPVVLTQPDVRRFIRRLLEVELPTLVVLSYQELIPEVSVQPIARIGI